MNTITKISLSMHAACFAACIAAAAQASEPEGTENDPMKVAQELDQQGRDLEARFYYGKALTQHPRNVAALAAIGLLEVRMGETGPAKVHLARLQRACAKCTETAQLRRALLTPRAAAQADPAPRNTGKPW